MAYIYTCIYQLNVSNILLEEGKQIGKWNKTI